MADEIDVHEEFSGDKVTARDERIRRAAGGAVMTGCELISAERWRQINEEGWTAEHDDEHCNGELARAGACYALPPMYRSKEIWSAPLLDLLWPWDSEWWKPGHEHPKAHDDRIRDLAKAGALIAAEIDRIQRENLREVKP